MSQMSSSPFHQGFTLGAVSSLTCLISPGNVPALENGLNRVLLAPKYTRDSKGNGSLFLGSAACEYKRPWFLRELSENKGYYYEKHNNHEHPTLDYKIAVLLCAAERMYAVRCCCAAVVRVPSRPDAVHTRTHTPADDVR